MTALHSLSQFIAGTRYEQLPADVIARAVEVIRDSVGCAIAGMREPEVAALAAYAAQQHPGPCRLIGQGGGASAAWAIRANSCAGNSLELDEGHAFAVGHAAIHAWPVALALHQRDGTSMHDFLLHFVLGYEAAARAGIGTKLKPAAHMFGAWGVVGAAAIAARARGCNAQDVAEVIELAASYAITPSFGSALQGANVRNTYSGMVNANGLLAAEMHALGFRGERGGLNVAFGQLLGDAFDERALADGLGERWEILRGYFKPFSSCRFTHSTVQCLLEMDAPALERGRIKRIDVHTYAMAARLNAMHPTTPLGGRFSIPHVVAALLTLGHADPAAFGDAALRDPRVAQLRTLVQVHEDPALSALLPARRPARVRITLDDGRVVTHEVTRTKGDPDLPMTAAELRDKFIRLAAPTLGEARAAALHADLGRLADLQRLPDHVFVTFANATAA